MRVIRKNMRGVANELDWLIVRFLLFDGLNHAGWLNYNELKLSLADYCSCFLDKYRATGN